jgi:hypothetical protein
MSTSFGHEKCPYLWLYYDVEPLRDIPNAVNQCRAQEPPLSIELSYQASTCLGGDWSKCPRYQAALRRIIAEEDTAAPYPVVAPPAKESSRGGVPLWLIVGNVILAVAVFAIVFFVLRPLVFPPQAPTSTALPVVANPSVTHSATASPEPSLTPTLTPSPTPSPMPTDTALPSPTPTVVPTTPPTDTPVPLPTDTPVPTRRPTNTPRPTARPNTPTPPNPQYPAPVLVAPPNGTAFTEGDQIVLAWQSVGQLPSDIYYVPTVSYSHNGQTWLDETPWLKTLNWAVSEHGYLVDLSDDGLFQWSVQVMRQTGVDGNGRPIGTPVSPPSEARSFLWTPSGPGKPTPPPMASPTPIKTIEP